MIKLMQRLYKLCTELIWALLSLFQLGLLATSVAHAGVSLPNGTVNEYVEDMRVQALGGPVVIDRQYMEGRWEINARWNPAVYSGEPQTTGSCVAYPTIKVREREYAGDGVAWSLENRYTIRAKDYFAGADCEPNRIQTLRWQDRNTGQWMEFKRADETQLQYQLVRYGDRNDNTVTLDYDTDSQPDLANLTAGKIKYVRDTNNNILYTFTYTGNNLTEIQDNPSIIPGNTATPRSVQYAYTNTTYKGQTYQTINQVTDVLGNITKYGINNGNLVSIEDAESTVDKPRIRTYTYSADRVVKYKDALGNETTYKYDYDRNKQEFYVRIDAPPATPAATEYLITENWYSKNGDLIRTDLNGKTDYLKSEIDAATRSYVVTDAAGNRTKITEDEYGNVIKTEYADGAIRTATYSSIHGSVTSETDELGVITKYDYDSVGNLTKKTEAIGLPEQRVTEYTRNAQGQIVSKILKGTTTTLPVVPINGPQIITSPDRAALYEYDVFGNLVRVIDGEGNSAKFSYDIQGNNINFTDANKGVWLTEYDASGHIISSTNPLGHTRQRSYDKVNNLTSLTDAEGNQSRFTYDDENRVITEQDALGNISSTHYDSLGRIVKTIDAANNPYVSMKYNVRGHLIEHIDAVGNVLRLNYDDSIDANNPREVIYNEVTSNLRYDKRNRVVSEVRLAASTSDNTDVGNQQHEEMTYNQRGQIIKVKDANGNLAYLSYDAFGNLVKSVDALGAVTYYSYDNNDNLIAVTDAKNNVTQYQYDLSNRQTSIVWPLGETFYYAYDANSNLIRKTDNIGNVITYSYDAANRLTRETHLSSSSNGVTREISYSYNKVGTLVGYNDINTAHNDHKTHSAKYTIDALQRRTVEEVTIGNQTFQLMTTYDDNGNKSSQSMLDGLVNGAGSAAINYEYDGAQRLKSISLPNAGNISINGYEFDQVTNILYPGGGTSGFSYDGFRRLARINSRSGSQQTLQQRQYVYDSVNNITSISAENNNKYQYQYDNNSRLTYAENSNGVIEENYSYDKLGNRLLDNNKPNPSDSNGMWLYNENNQLTQRGTLNTASIGNNSMVVDYQYDANGNQVSVRTQVGTETQFPYQNQRHLYDAQNRLIAVRDHQNSLIASYQYDPDGRRIRKTLHRKLNEDNLWQPLAATERYHYYYADEGLVAEYKILEDSVGAESGNAPLLVAQYGWRPNNDFWGAAPVWIKTTGKGESSPDYYYYHNDHLGTPLQIVDSAGNIVWQQKSTAFGETSLSSMDLSGAITSNLRFAGQYYDIETDNNYNYFRTYNPKLGRYTQYDPIGLDDGLNAYEYVESNPVNYIDAKGKSVDKLIVGGIVIWRLYKYICKKPNSTTCKAFKRCLKNPKKCKKDFCKKKPNRTYHGESNNGVCDVPGCKPNDGPATARFKLGAAQACIILRKFVSTVCFNKKSDPNHRREIEIAKEKVRSCVRLCEF